MTRQSGNRLTEMNDRFDRVEGKIDDLARLIFSIAKREFKRDMRQMFNFDKMNASIAKIRDIASSVKAAYDGVVAQRDAAIAERDALKADDTADAEKLAAAEASLVAAEEMLKTLQAIAEGTPVVLPPLEPPVGGSVGNIPATE